MNNDVFGVKHQISDLFKVNVDGEVNGYNVPIEGFTPQTDPDYIFDEKVLESFIFDFLRSDTIGAMMIGEKGSGKSQFVKQYFGLLNFPVIIHQCHARDTKNSLFFQYLPTEVAGQFKLAPGPVALAMQSGIPVLLDEYNLLPPEAAVALNTVLDGSPIFVEQLGGMVYPQPGFKIIGTMNPGDDAEQYQGRNQLDGSNEDRFMAFLFDYLPQEQEARVIGQCLTALSDTQRANVAEWFVHIAGSIREQYKQRFSQPSGLTTTISTRSLKRVARMMNRRIERFTQRVEAAIRDGVDVAKIGNADSALAAIYDCFNVGFANHRPEHEKLAIESIIEAKTGIKKPT